MSGGLAAAPVDTDGWNDPVPWTGGPWQLLWADVQLMVSCLPAVKGILWPLRSRTLDFRDELNLGSWQNVVSVVLHGILIVTQSIFLISLPFCAFLPIFWVLIHCGLFYILNAILTFILNGKTIKFESQVPLANEEKHADEFWVYLNGVSVGCVGMCCECHALLADLLGH
jgi:hypothetical protein